MKIESRLVSWWIPAFAVTAVSIALFGATARLDPEPYHDGSQVPAAIGVARGLHVHEDVFSAYGFVTAWLQGFAVEVFGSQLIVIRLFTAVVTSIVALLLFLFTKYVTKSTVLALAASLVWVVTWPGISVEWGTPFLPWPSNLFLLWQISAIMLVACTLLNNSRRSLVLIAAGSMTTLAVLTRINYGAALAAALLITALLFARQAGWRAKDWGFLSVGVFITLTIPLIILAAQGSLIAFIDQSIVGALKGEAIVKPTEWFYIENGYLWGSLLLIIALSILWLSSSWNWIKPSFFVVLTVLTTVGLTIWASTAIPGSPLRELILSRLTWSPALDIQAMQPLYLIAVITIFSTVALVVVLVKNRISNSEHHSRSQQVPRTRVLVTLLITTGAASLIQLYPVADPNHLWWAAPIPIILLVFMVREVKPSKRRNALLAALLLPPLLIAPFTIWIHFSAPRIEIQGNVLTGMMVDQKYANSYAQMDILLEGIAPRSTEFLCKEGLFSVWNGEYLSSGPGYVDYAYELDSAASSTESTTTILCLPWGNETTAESYAQENGLLISEKTGDISLSYFSDIQVFRLEKSTK